MTSAHSPRSGVAYTARSDRLAMRPLSRRDVGDVVCWMADADVLRETFPMDVPPREVDVVALVESADPTGTPMSWAFDLPDGTPVGIGHWYEDVPWFGVYHLGVMLTSLVADREELVVAAYRLLCGRVFDTLSARKVTARMFDIPPNCGAVFDRVGMTREGILRRHSARDLVEYDIHLFGMNRNEWGTGNEA